MKAKSNLKHNAIKINYKKIVFIIMLFMMVFNSGIANTLMTAQAADGGGISIVGTAGGKGDYKTQGVRSQQDGGGIYVLGTAGGNGHHKIQGVRSQQDGTDPAPTVDLTPTSDPASTVDLTPTSDPTPTAIPTVQITPEASPEAKAGGSGAEPTGTPAPEKGAAPGSALSANFQDYLTAVSYTVMRNGASVTLASTAQVFPGEQVTIRFDFAIPNNVTFQADNTTSLSFNSGLPFVTNASGTYNPMSGDLADLAEYSLSNPGFVTLRFKQNSVNVSNIVGSIQLTANALQAVTEPQVLTTAIGTYPAVILNLVPDPTSACQNARIVKVYNSYNPKTQIVSWGATISSGDGRDLDGLQFVDRIGDNHTLESLFIFMNSTWQPVTSSLSEDKRTVTYRLPAGVGTEARFRINTRLNDGYINGETGKKVKNTAKVYASNAQPPLDSVEPLASAEAITGELNQGNGKSGGTVVKENGRIKIPFTISWNNNYLSRSAGWTLVDYIETTATPVVRLSGATVENLTIKTGSGSILTAGSDYSVTYPGQSHQKI